jgi:hypothetical protein
MMPVLRYILICSVVGLSTPSVAAGNFPRASCSTWNGTIVSISGIDTSKAEMTGTVTRADVQEYCARDSGGETVQHGGKLTIAECVERYLKMTRGGKLFAKADCVRASLEFHDGSDVKRVRFPVEDTSCASGNAPLVSQFKKLCPTRAMGLNWPTR